jgi:heptose I phosphotransferase
MLAMAISSMVEVDPGRVWLDPKYADIFQQHGLASFESFMGYMGGTRYKKNQFREVIRLEWTNVSPLFFKRHFAPSRKQNIYAWLCLHRPVSSARHEVEAAQFFHEAGIRTMKPVGFGELPGKFWEGPSFIITEEVPQAIKLEWYLVEKAEKVQKDLVFRRKLIEELARITRQMHEHNIHHQDFYLGHILISWPDKDTFMLHLIDLQRAHQREHLKDRWRIKDLSQINYSTPLGLLTRTDRLRFFKQYLGRSTLTAQDRQWIQTILRRNRKMCLHDLHRKRIQQTKVSKLTTEDAIWKEL